MVRWVGLVLALAVTRLGAQNAEAASVVPDAYRPPPGMCRIWIDGVPPDRQPAPTDCATAVRRRPANAHVVFGDLSTYVAPVGAQQQAKPPTTSAPATPRTSPPAATPASRDGPPESSPPEPKAEPRPAAPPSANPAARPAPAQPMAPARTNAPPAQQTAAPTGHPPRRAF